MRWLMDDLEGYLAGDSRSPAAGLFRLVGRRPSIQTGCPEPDLDRGNVGFRADRGECTWDNGVHVHEGDASTCTDTFL